MDDLSSATCVSLLRRIAHGGRTVVCSVHTPSAKTFAMFDHVYIAANGQCVYQGQGANIVNYMQMLNLNCPKTYNPADFSKFNIFLVIDRKVITAICNSLVFFIVIEVSSGAYGPEFLDKMVAAVDNGRVHRWKTANNNDPNDPLKIESFDMAGGENNIISIVPFIEEINVDHLKAKCSSWQLFSILFRRASKQIYRNKVK